MATVTYTGSDGALSHPAPSGKRYTMHRKQPCKILDEDVAFYREKEARGSPFRVEPKLIKVVAKEKSFPVPAPKIRPPRKVPAVKKSGAAPSRRTPANTRKSKK